MAHRLFLILFLTFLPVGAVLAQETTGTITGIVMDTSGAVVPGASVTVTNTLTNQARTLVTNEVGIYFASLLPPGRYSVRVELSSFRSFLAEGLTLSVNQVLAVNATLQVGGTTDTVTVTANQVAVDTKTSSVATVVNHQQVVELPLNGRSFLQLATLQPGVSIGPTTTQIIDPVRPGAGLSASPTADGMRPQSNLFLIDGASNVDRGVNTAGLIPPPDAIEEFSIISNLFKAEFGGAGGSVINIVTRTGTNQYRASLYEFFRNDNLNARNYFAQQKPPFGQNQFGGTFGGPIRRGKTFFFASYEKLKLDKGLPVVSTVPSLLERRGDFSASANKPINPATGQRFPGDVIPPSMLDPIGATLVGFYPPPNTGSNGFSQAPSQSTDTNQLSLSFDHSLSASSTLIGRYMIQDGPTTRPFPLLSGRGIETPGFAAKDAIRMQNFVIGNRTVFSSRTLNEVRFVFNRFKLNSGLPVEQRDLTQAGFAYPLQTDIKYFPGIDVSGFASMGNSDPVTRLTNSWQVQENVLLQRGAHSIKLGGSLERAQYDWCFYAGASGIYTFSGAVTGNPMADLLLGKTFVFVQGGGQPCRNFRGTNGAVFGQDDWQVTGRLTLNLGLRYEMFQPIYDTGNRLFAFAPGRQSTVRPDAPPGFLVNGDAGIPRGIFPVDKGNIGPRVGLAWDVDGTGKSSLRGGAGIFYDPSVLFNQANMIVSSPSYPLVSTVLPASLADPFAGKSIFAGDVTQQPIPRNLRLNNISTDIKTARVYHWNVSYERSLFHDLVAQVTYVGNHASNLMGRRNINQAKLSPTATSANIQARRPYLDYREINLVESIYDSHYNGLQLSLERAFIKGYAFRTSYTYGKAIDLESGPGQFFITGQVERPQNSYDIEAERGPSAWDVRHRFVASFLLDLPFRRGGIAGAVLRDWQVNGIIIAQSGNPFTVYDSSDPALTGDATQRPNLVGDPNNGPNSSQKWFNTEAFQRLAKGTQAFGNAGRNIVTGPPLRTVDIALVRNVPFGGARRLQLRVEMFNVFNSPNFDMPDNNIASPTFGQILRTRTDARSVQLAVKLYF